jgi:hypothetical protein
MGPPENATAHPENQDARRRRLATFPNEQRFDLAGVLGRLDSSSYAPAAGSEEHARMAERLTELFAECEVDGRVAFRYETKVYVGLVGD